MQQILSFLLLAFIACPIAQLTAQDEYKKLLHLSYAELDSLVRIPYKKGDFAGCIPYMQAGREKAKVEFGDQDSVFALYTANLGFFYDETGQHKQAEPLYLQAMAIKKKSLGEQHPSYALSLGNLARLYENMGDYAKAEPLLLQAMAIHKKASGEQHPKYATSLNNLAAFYYLMGNYAKAEPLYFQAMAIQKKNLGEQHLDYAQSLNNLASLYHAMGNYTKAEPLYLQSMAIKKKALGEQHSSYALSLNNLARLYDDMGNYTKAEPFYLDAIAIYKKALGEQHPSYATSLNSLAALYYNMGNYTKAEPLYLQAIAIRKKALGEQHPSYANSLNNLAALYYKMGNYTNAEPLYLQAMAIRKKSLGEQHPSYAASLHNLAGLYKDMNKLDSAFYYCQLGIIANTAIDSNSQDWSKLDEFDYFSNKQINTSIQTFLAILRAQYKKTNDKNKLEMCYAVAKAAMRLNERIRNDFSNDKEKLRILENNAIIVKYGIDAALDFNNPTCFEEAFSFAEQNKSILLADVLKSKEAMALAILPDSLSYEEISLQQQKIILNRKKYETKDEEKKQYLVAQENELNQKIDNFMLFIKVNHPKYYKLKYKNITPSANDIQNLLPDSTLFLEYFVSDSMTYIFALNKQEVKIYPIKITKTAIHSLVKKYQQYVASDSLIRAQKENDSYKGLSEISLELYNKILSPALDDFKTIMNLKNLIIIPDGELGHVAFETLISKPASKDKKWGSLHYIINDYSISYHYSATLFADAVNSHNGKENVGTLQKNTLLAMAPSYKKREDVSNTRSPISRDALSPLRFAKADVENLDKTFVTKACIGDTVTADLFKKIAKNYNIIHLAMHAASDIAEPLRASLAFTNQVDTSTDVFLEAWQISSQLEFKNTNLVVLSACESGYGKFEQGEGVMSLARAFFYAGVSSLVVSYWLVDDATTSEIMLNFYKNLNAQIDKATALQQAKLSYINKNKGVSSHPYYWAALIQLGSNNPLGLESK